MTNKHLKKLKKYISFVTTKPFDKIKNSILEFNKKHSSRLNQFRQKYIVPITTVGCLLLFLFGFIVSINYNRGLKLAKAAITSGYGCGNYGASNYNRACPRNDRLDPTGTPNASIKNSAGSAAPLKTDTSYSVVVGDVSPIKAEDGQPLNAAMGTCKVTIGGITYTNTGGIISGKCTITSIPMPTGSALPGGTVRISDGAVGGAMEQDVNYSGINLPDPSGPVVTINKPTTNTIINNGASTKVEATAVTSSGYNITKVEFFVDSTKIGEDIDSPYSYDWTPTNLSLGVHQLTAKASDNNNQTNSSLPVAITITKLLGSSDIPGLTVSCDSAKVNSTTKCTFTLPDYNTLPSDFKIGIGDGGASGECSVSGNKVTCINVQTGSGSGQKPIYGYINNTKTDTGEKVDITNNILTTVRSGGFVAASAAGLALLGSSILVGLKIRKRKLKI